MTSLTTTRSWRYTLLPLGCPTSDTDSCCLAAVHVHKGTLQPRFTRPCPCCCQVEQRGEVRVLWHRFYFSTFLTVTEDGRDPHAMKASFALIKSVGSLPPTHTVPWSCLAQPVVQAPAAAHGMAYL